MPRANRYFTAGRYYHVTHRCHNRAFLLKFAKDRDRYRTMLRERLPRHGVSLIGYCITSNHVHLLMTAQQQDNIAGLMHSLAGDFSREYNRKKGRTNAFWGERYHATLVESGLSMWRCLRYIDLNMVRAGVVAHPNRWEWCGFQELSGARKRYCLIDKKRLLDAVEDTGSLADFCKAYLASITEALGSGYPVRQSAWTEAFAVGSEQFIRQSAHGIKNRRYLEAVDDEDPEVGWTLRERRASYDQTTSTPPES